MEKKVWPFGEPGAVAAHWMLLGYEQARKDNSALKDDMTLMKLIKLVYVAHGFHLVNYNAPLVKKPIEAWANGPVVPEIYDAAKMLWGMHTGREYVPSPAFDSFVHIVHDGGNATDATKRLINKVAAVYGDADGVTLSRASHADDTPWSAVYEEDKRNPIDNDVIRRHYLKINAAEDNTPMGL